MIGMLAGYALKKMSIESTLHKITEHFVSLFMILLLPPIIFESGYNMQKKPFIRNIGTVLMFSFLGTFIAIFFSSTMFWITG
jgi:NhaP-type Na+/H+ or K+/H+ antiporter